MMTDREKMMDILRVKARGIQCDECGKTFNFTANIKVTYSTSRRENEE